MQTLIKKPLYKQVADLLSDRIRSGEWREMQPIPCEFDLATELQVSIGTIRKAVDMLVEMQLVERRQGKGTFVIDRCAACIQNAYDPIRNADGSLVQWAWQELSCACGACSEEECEILKLPRGAKVLRISYVGFLGSRPLMYVVSTMPADVFGDVSGLSASEKTVTALAHRAGLLLGEGSEKVDVRCVSRDGAVALGVEASALILRLRRVIADSKERPIEWRVAECNLRNEFYLAQRIKPWLLRVYEPTGGCLRP